MTLTLTPRLRTHRAVPRQPSQEAGLGTGCGQVEAGGAGDGLGPVVRAEPRLTAHEAALNA
jgi:hypothetical protein